MVESWVEGGRKKREISHSLADEREQRMRGADGGGRALWDAGGLRGGEESARERMGGWVYLVDIVRLIVFGFLLNVKIKGWDLWSILEGGGALLRMCRGTSLIAPEHVQRVPASPPLLLDLKNT